MNLTLLILMCVSIVSRATLPGPVNIERIRALRSEANSLSVQIANQLDRLAKLRQELSQLYSLEESVLDYCEEFIQNTNASASDQLADEDIHNLCWLVNEIREGITLTKSLLRQTENAALQSVAQAHVLDLQAWEIEMALDH